jgi:choline dehydrogenase-like flavoprotein
VLEVGARPLRGNVDTYRPDWELRGEHFLPKDKARDRITLGRESEDFHLVRFKGVGGSTMHYEGLSQRMHPMHLRRATEHGVGADWPVTYEQLAPLYDRVEQRLGLSGTLDDPFAPPRPDFPNPPLAMSCITRRLAEAATKLGLHPAHAPLAILSRARGSQGECNFCGSCSYGCLHGAISNMSETYLVDAEMSGARILTGCMASRVRVAADDRTVTGVEFLDEDGALHFQPAAAVAICGNGVETPRLLLLSYSPGHPDGLANGSGLVGRHFMAHAHVRVGAMVAERIDAWRGPNINGVINDYCPSDPRRGFLGGYTIALRNAQFGPAYFLHEWPLRQRLIGPELHAAMERGFGHSFEIDAYGESLPDVDNRVELDPNVTDSFGIPVPRITIRHDDNSRAMVVHMIRTLRDIAEAAGGTDVQVLRDGRFLGTHLMGTCRMGEDPTTSVCDPFGQTHEIRNLFIADGSLFPTATPMNPTLTIQALATRIAFHIDDRLASGTF